jgi:hypothetical protein
MRPRISKICLVLYVIWFLLSLMLLSVSGDYWPWYLIMSGVSVVAMIVGPNRYRIFGALALGFSVILIFGDIQSGKTFRAKIERIRQAHSLTNSP